MRNIVLAAVALSAVLSFAHPASGAEAVKLRPMSSAYLDGNGRPLKVPEGVAFDGKSVLAVADTGNGKIQLYAFRDERLAPQASLTLPQLTYPIRLQFDPKGEILALDGKTRRISRLTTSGEFRGYVDPAGLPTAGTVVPRSFKVDGKGDIYILDVFTGRVLVLDQEAKFQREVPFPGSFGFFSDLAVDENGNIFLVDSVGARVYAAKRSDKEFKPYTESLREDLDFPVAIAVDGRGRLYLSDQDGGGIVILGSDGSFRGRQSEFGWKEGFLRYPCALQVSDGGALFIADRGNSRVQVFAVVQ